jgi:hypothetical protein
MIQEVYKSKCDSALCICSVQLYTWVYGHFIDYYITTKRHHTPLHIGGCEVGVDDN